MAKLFIVGTPIGNPDDISIRALKYLDRAKNIVAENPESFAKLLGSFGLDKSNAKIMYAHTWPDYIGEEPIIEEAISLLKSGEDVYVFCDGGMPGVADPGGLLINKCIKEKIEIVSTPGPSIVISAAVSAGYSNELFFTGFIPKDERHRKTFLERYSNNIMPNLFLLINQKDYLASVMDDLLKIWGDRNGALCYNLTTKKEHITHGTLSELRQDLMYTYVSENEVCLIVDGNHRFMV
ncbi:hypothetical protein EBU71_20530 [bacterium]|nr:hypothetical protein [Candidatus Elulimicrobium humile]